jgi:hypothetical protein
MLQFHDPIPNLAGKVCVDLLAQEYWHRGKQANPANALLLHVNDGQWHRFFIDAGVVFWRSASAQPSLPPSDGQRRYVLADLGERYRIAGHAISRIHTVDLSDRGEIRLEFSNAPSVILRDLRDKTELEIGTDVTSNA